MRTAFEKIATDLRDWVFPTGCPTSLRIGPNPFLTMTALIGAGGESILLFLRKPIDFRNHELLAACLVAGIIWFWLTLVWGVWFLVRPVNNTKRRPFLKWPIYLAIALIIFSAALAYSISWFAFLYSGVFPGGEALGFIQSGSETDLKFILFVVQQTIPNVLSYFTIFCIGLAVATPFGLNRILRSRWTVTNEIGQRLAAILAWVGTGFIAIFCLSLISVEWKLERETFGLERIRTQMNPAFSIAANILAPRPKQKIAPDIDMAFLTPISEEQNENVPAAVAAEARPSILYLAIESLRADVLFGKHQGIEIMPNLNALARRSLVFTNAHSQSTHTDYSLFGYLSSLYPLRSQQHLNWDKKNPWPKTLIYEALKPYGYSTAIITSDNTGWCNMNGFMWSKSLDVFYDATNLPARFVPPEQNRGYVDDREIPVEANGGTNDDKKTVRYAMEWIRRKINNDQTYFLHLFFQQTHFSYFLPIGAPEPFQPCERDFTATFDAYPRDKVEVMRNAYLNAAHYVDIQIGMLVGFLEETGQLDNTIIVLCGDHGEAFLEHGYITHSRAPYEELTHVPMLIYAPKSDQPRKIDYPAEQIDMPPTLLGLLGIDAPEVFQGIDVLSTDRPPLKDRYVYSHVNAPMQGNGEAIIHAGRWKYLYDRRKNAGNLFDLKNDPDEKHDIKEAEPQIAAKLRSRLFRWRANQLAYYKYNMYYENYYPPNQ